MEPRISLKAGAACGVVGALGIFLGNFLHPFPPPGAEAMLRVIADEPARPAIHFPTMFFALAILAALVALADSITHGPAASLARMGRTVAQAAVPVMLVGVAIDGFAFRALARLWAGAPAAEREMIVRAADAVILAETGILHTWVSFFLGLAFLLYGAALVVGSEYPRALGWLGVVGGAGCLVSGATGFLGLPLTVPFPIFGTLVLAWTFAMGVVMARRAGAGDAEPRPRPGPSVPAAPGVP
jgi:hypothetical protein